jgi:hypothetical protein
MNKKSCVFICLLIFISIAEAIINLSTTRDRLMVSFDPWQLSDPIGCIYIDSIYLTKLSLEEIQNGNAVIDTINFAKKLANRNAFRIAVIIEGFSGNEFIRKIQASDFVRINANYNYLGEADVESNMKNFIFQKFTELRKI